MDLYGFWRSQATFRVRVALNLKELDHREIPIDLDRGEQHQEAFRQISPMGSVPALIIDGQSLSQSLAILEYLEETHPEPSLLPADALGRARVRSLAAIAVSDAHPLIVPRVRRYLDDHAGFDGVRWKAWQTMWFSAGLRGFEARLVKDSETGTYCHGERPTMADICLAGLYGGATIFGIEVDQIPNVRRIVKSCRALPAFADADPRRQPDYPG